VDIFWGIEMTKRHRLQTHKRGRKTKAIPRTRQNQNLLGGIPMIIKNGIILYGDKVPKGFSYNSRRKCDSDAEEMFRNRAILPQGEGDFQRRHIYEMRFGIRTDESDDERRKREYHDWWENEQRK